MCYVPAVAVDSQDEISRRDLLRAIAFGTIAAGLTACGSPFSPTASASESAGLKSPSEPPSATPPSSASVLSTVEPTTAPDPALRQEIGQLLVAGFRGRETSNSSAVGRAIAAGELGGVILFDRNIASPNQLADLTRGLAVLAPREVPLLVAIDQEGGKIMRLGPSHGFPNVPSQEAVGRHSVAYATTIYDDMAATLSAAGITLNLAPVVDVDVNPLNPAIGALDRSFSADPAVVTTMARAEIEAHHDHRVRATIKHFPGLGSASANTDFATVDVTRTWSRAELRPFRDLLGGTADCVMVGHINNATLDATWPASLSKATVDGLLRGELGWCGPVITDDLQAKAITTRYRRADAIAAALNAGVDLLLFAVATADARFYSDLVDSIVALVTSGRVSRARINQAAARVAILRPRA